MMKISQNFVAFSDYMNFTSKYLFYIDETFDFQLCLTVMKGLTRKNGVFMEHYIKYYYMPQMIDPHFQDTKKCFRTTSL